MTTRSRVRSTRSARPVQPNWPAPWLLVPLAALWLSGCSLLNPGAGPEPLLAVPDAAPIDPLDQVIITPSRLIGRSIDFIPVTLSSPPDDEPPVDLVGRIRSGFSLPGSDDPSVASELAWYANHPEYIERVFGRGSRYLHHIVETLEARGMPADIALLPIVESAFDPFAYSRGRASGLWQIIPGTGDMLGLKQNWWYDGRRDIVDSTRAALDYLELLHEKFDGDWLLAIAGYNSGEGHVARAIENARREGRPTDFWSLRKDLRSETAAYVPKLIAIRDLVANSEAHDIELPVIENEPFFATVETEGQIDVALAAELGSISIDALYELNPGINRWATDPEGPHRLLVPVDVAADIETALASLDATERVRWTRHRISRGETLSEIAENFQTTPSVLREINGLAGNIIRAGDHLMIPHASAAAGSYSLSLDARTTRQQERERDGNRIDYQVRPGDSLWSIAQRFRVRTEELAIWNAMAPRDTLAVGRNLVIWTDEPLTASPASIDGPSAIRQVNYVVRSGDSLASIAGRFRVTVASLLDWNSLSADRYLQPGQALVLYVDVTEQST
jgi:membrane-bound lytic murein transglycosylase D